MQFRIFLIFAENLTILSLNMINSIPLETSIKEQKSTFSTWINKILLVDLSALVLFNYLPSSMVSLFCDTIKGNESHVGNFHFWFYNMNHLSI